MDGFIKPRIFIPYDLLTKHACLNCTISDFFATNNAHFDSESRSSVNELCWVVPLHCQDDWRNSPASPQTFNSRCSDVPDRTAEDVKGIESDPRPVR